VVAKVEKLEKIVVQVLEAERVAGVLVGVVAVALATT